MIAYLAFLNYFIEDVNYDWISHEMNFILISTEKRRENIIITIVSWIITFLILVGIGTLIAKLKNKK